MSCIDYGLGNYFIIINLNVKRICEMEQNHSLLLQCFINLAGKKAKGENEYVLKNVTYPIIDIFSQRSFSESTYRKSLKYLETVNFVKRETVLGKPSRFILMVENIQNAIRNLPPSPKSLDPSLLNLLEEEPTLFENEPINSTSHPSNFTSHPIETTSPTLVTLLANNIIESNFQVIASKPNFPTTAVVDPSSVDIEAIPESLNAYALTGSGSTIDNRLRDFCHIANSDISPSSQSQTALECKDTVSSEDNVEFPILNPGSSVNETYMTSHEVVQSIFSTYAKLPNNIKDHRQKGSAVQLFKKFGDLLIKTVADDGEVAVAAFTSFIQDEYWKSQGWPFFAFAKQYNEFLIRGDGEGPEKSNDASTPRKNAKFSTFNKRPTPGFPVKFENEPAQRFIPIYKADSTAKARHKRDETLTLLQSANSSLFDACMDELYGPITDDILSKIDSWHEKAVVEFKQKLKREPVVKCSYLVGKE